MPLATKIDYIADAFVIIVMITPNVIQEILSCQIFTTDIDLMKNWISKLSDLA